MGGMDVKLENEKMRQNNLLRTLMNEKRTKNHNIIELGEIIDRDHEAHLA